MRKKTVAMAILLSPDGYEFRHYLDLRGHEPGARIVELLGSRGAWKILSMGPAVPFRRGMDCWTVVKVMKKGS